MPAMTTSNASFPAPARRLLASSVLARIPTAMLSLALLVHIQRLTGSYGVAGLATGAYAVAVGLGGPLLGRLADRRGQHSVLLLGGAATALQLVALAVLPAAAPTALLVALAAGIGVTRPPVGACLRAALPALVADPSAARRVFAIEATATELTFIAGPSLALAVASAWSTRVALGGAGVVVLAATALFAVQAADARATAALAVGADPAAPSRSLAGSLASPTIVALIMLLIGVGVAFGAVEVSTAAAAAHVHSIASAAPLLSLWAVGSLIGGLLTARVGGERLSLGTVVVALAISHTACALGADSTVLLGVLILFAGATIAPTYTVIYAIAGDAAPAGTSTEAFAWLATAISVGTAAGSAIAGTVVDHAGAAAGFLVAGAGGLAAITIVVARATQLAAASAPSPA
jgi:MFS family permease